LGFAKKAAGSSDPTRKSADDTPGLPPRGGGAMRKSQDDSIPHPHVSFFFLRVAYPSWWIVLFGVFSPFAPPKPHQQQNEITAVLSNKINTKMLRW